MTGSTPCSASLPSGPPGISETVGVPDSGIEADIILDRNQPSKRAKPELRACSANGWAFGRFSDELRRLLILSKRRPNHAKLVKESAPKRLVCWLQDELKRFNTEREAEPFTLHDFRRTAVSALQMAGVSEKETSLMVGAASKVIRKHYEKLDAKAIAKRNVERRLNPKAPTSARPLRAGRARALDRRSDLSQTVTG